MIRVDMRRSMGGKGREECVAMCASLSADEMITEKVVNRSP